MKMLTLMHHFMQIPHVNRQEYTLLDVSEDGYVSRLPACQHCFCDCEGSQYSIYIFVMCVCH